MDALPKSQIPGFFSRLSSSKKRKTSPVPNTGGDDADEDCLDQEDLDHMNTVQTVVKEIGLSHPIFYDIYEVDFVYSFHAQRNLHIL